jgi:hypothetical protein
VQLDNTTMTMIITNMSTGEDGSEILEEEFEHHRMTLNVPREKFHAKSHAPVQLR